MKYLDEIPELKDNRFFHTDSLYPIKTLFTGYSTSQDLRIYSVTI